LIMSQYKLMIDIYRRLEINKYSVTINHIKDK
jgi:hypothetical protein